MNKEAILNIAKSLVAVAVASSAGATVVDMYVEVELFNRLKKEFKRYQKGD